MLPHFLLSGGILKIYAPCKLLQLRTFGCLQQLAAFGSVTTFLLGQAKLGKNDGKATSRWCVGSRVKEKKRGHFILGMRFSVC